jgi:hypothetical protein
LWHDVKKALGAFLARHLLPILAVSLAAALLQLAEALKVAAELLNKLYGS